MAGVTLAGKPTVGGDTGAWGLKLNTLLEGLDDRIEALEAAGSQVAGVLSISTDGANQLQGDVDLSESFAPITHFHAGEDITSGTVAIARLHTAVPIVVVKAKGGFGASAGNWPANRAAITADATRTIIFIGNSDPGTGLMSDQVDVYIIVP